MLTQNLTKKTYLALLSLLLLAALSIVGLGHQESQAAQESRRAEFASLRSLSGRYVDYATATVLPGGFAPAACVGIATFDGRGHFKATETHSFNGTIIPEAHYTGTYIINDDYSGIMTWHSVEQGFDFKEKFVLNPVTNEITYIVTEDGELSTGTLKKMQ
ncbi:MAG: hypothetical protein U0Y68_19735 [Blastocatellia bacterium]